jgi:aspartate ammonia-lyase
MVNKKLDLRIERDSLGDMQIPVGAYWGAQTARTKEHLAVSGLRTHPKLIDALVLVKKAAAITNGELESLETATSRAIVQSCDEIASGQWKEQFVADAFHWGAGEGLNANVNEVLANRGAEIVGGSVGTYDFLDPNAHVNFGHCNNDVYPTAMRIALLLSLKQLEPTLVDLERLLRRKSLEFDRVVKVGRTHLQDCSPVTLGQEFNAYGSSVERSVKRIKEASQSLLELNLGSAEIGTGYGVDANLGKKMIERLCAMTNLRLRQAEDLFRVTQSMADFLEFSSSLRGLAVDLIKICNDLKLLASGPGGGFGELSLPVVQSLPNSIHKEQLSDKSLPHLPECLIMACYQVLGNDYTIVLAAQSGQLEANSMTPLIIHNLLQSLDLLRNAIGPFNQKCLAGVTANIMRCNELLDKSGIRHKEM